MVDLEYVKGNLREGWMLNPNEKIVNGIIKGINRCNGDCPCNNDSEENNTDEILKVTDNEKFFTIKLFFIFFN